MIANNQRIWQNGYNLQEESSMRRKLFRIGMALLTFVVLPLQAIEGRHYGFVDLEKVLSAPVVASKFEELKSEFQLRHDEFSAAQDRLEAMVAEHEKESSMMTKIVRENREQELKEMAHKLSKEGTQMTQEYYQRTQELKAGYFKQASDIAQQLSIKYGLKFVMAKHNLLYIDESLDLTDELILQLT